MKKLLIIFAIAMIALVSVTPAQNTSLRDEEFATEFVYLKRNIDITTLSGNTLRPDKLTDSAGFRVGYYHSFGRKGGRGDLAIGVEGGATFDQVDGERVGLIRGQYAMRWQANGTKRFHPFIKGTAGVASETLRKIVVRQSPGGGIVFGSNEVSFTYGGGVGFDIRLKEGGRRRWRVGAEYFNTSLNNGNQHNVEVSTGIVW